MQSEGQNELQRIYSEAEQLGEGHGAALQALWENDASDIIDLLWINGPMAIELSV